MNIGGGSGAVAVVAGRLYTIDSAGTTNDSDTIYCLNAETGEVIWTHSYPRPERTERTPTRRAATSTTPTVHEGKVYTFSGDAQLFCFDAATGSIIFSRDLMKEIGALHPQYDHNASPVIVGDLVILLVRLPDASIMAFDKTTGKEVWRDFHKTRRGALGGFWSTPVYGQIDGKPCLVYLPGLAVVGLDPATGETQWKYDFIKEEYPMAERGAVAASPVLSSNKIFFPFHPDHNRGFSGCIEITEGKPKLLWKSMKLAHWWHSPVLWKGCVYAVDQGPAALGNKAGALYCYDIATGALKWSTYEIGGTSRTTLTKGGKLLIADGKLMLLNDYGGLIVAGLTDESPKHLASANTRLRQGRMWTVPVLSGGRLYCRGGRGDLVCFDVSGTGR